MILGSNLKKGPLFDIIHDIPLSISADSQIQMITARAVSEIMQMLLLHKSKKNDIYNVGGVGIVSFRKLQSYFDKKIRVKRNTETQRYALNIEKIRRLYPNLGTSIEYMKEFLR